MFNICNVHLKERGCCAIIMSLYYARLSRGFIGEPFSSKQAPLFLGNCESGIVAWRLANLTRCRVAHKITRASPLKKIRVTRRITV